MPRLFLRNLAKLNIVRINEKVVSQSESGTRPALHTESEGEGEREIQELAISLTLTNP